ncbi:MAG: hypothetical protein FWB72_06890 [Firmicutes bacterium]|nr:hypothetical protein [Bacillota bacterium]
MTNVKVTKDTTEVGQVKNAAGADKKLEKASTTKVVADKKVDKKAEASTAKLSAVKEKAVLKVPGVTRQEFVIKTTGEIAHSYHITYLRAGQPFTIDLVIPRENQNMDKRVAYEAIEPLFATYSELEAHQAYVNNFGQEVDGKVDGARLAVRISGKIDIMGLETNATALLVPKSNVHSRALQEYFNAKTQIGRLTG